MKQGVFLILMSLAVEMSLSGCNNKKQEQLLFYYYPEKNIYYDIANKNYLYSLDGAGTWDSVHESSDKHPVVLGKNIVISTTVDSIWKDNEEHRKLYAGNIYTIINEDNRLDSAYNGAREKKVIKKTIKEPVQKEKPKKGFQKFIESIFKKNKNK